MVNNPQITCIMHNMHIPLKYALKMQNLHVEIDFHGDLSTVALRFCSQRLTTPKRVHRVRPIGILVPLVGLQLTKRPYVSVLLDIGQHEVDPSFSVFGLWGICT